MTEDRLDRIEKILEELARRDVVFDKRMEALTARHEALSESVEMIAHTLYRRKEGQSGN